MIRVIFRDGNWYLQGDALHGFDDLMLCDTQEMRRLINQLEQALESSQQPKTGSI